MPDGVKSHSYDEIFLGQKASLSVEVSPRLVDAFAELTGDVNPLHVSGDFARQKGFPDRLAHGLLCAGFFSTVVGTLLPGRDCLLQGVKFDFRKPVPAGERLTLEVEVKQKIDSVRALVMDARALDSKGEVVLSGRIQTGVIA